MKLYKSLCVYFATICFIATFCILHFTFVSTDYIPLAFLSAPVSVFSVSMVGLVASFVMYKSTQQTFIVLLKRRAGRVYAELLHHKMRLIDVIDGKRYVDIEKYLYHRDAFIKIKKLLYDEYFALFSYDPFFKNTKSYKAVTDFNSLHQDLLNYIRSQHIDNIEYNNLKILYQKVYRQPIVADTPEENFNHPDIIEAMENFRSNLDYALNNADTIMNFIDTHLYTLDEYFNTGESWAAIKERFDQEFQHWVQNPEVN